MKVSKLLTLFLLLCAGVTQAQVSMVSPMAPARADDVSAVWSAGELITVSVTAVVTGVNETGNPVGFMEEEWFIDPEDFMAALVERMNQPDPGVLDDIVDAVGLEFDGAGFFMYGFNLTVPSDGATGVCSGTAETGYQTIDQCFAYYKAQSGYPIGNIGYVDTHWGTAPTCGNRYLFYNTALNPTPPAHANVTPTSGMWAAFEGGNSCEVDAVGPVVLYAGATDFATLLPTSLIGDARPENSFPRESALTMNQAYRSSLMLQTTGMQVLANAATGVYEDEAYAGYPEFTLFYGFFAGLPDPPADEGDCDSTHCGGGTDPGGGTGDMTEVVDAIEGLQASLSDPDTFGPLDLPDAQTELEEASSEETALIECLETGGVGCTLSDDTYSTISGQVAGLIPDGGTCGTASFNIYPEKGFVITVDSCDMGYIRTVIEWALAAATLFGLYVMMTGSKGEVV